MELIEDQQYRAYSKFIVNKLSEENSFNDKEICNLLVAFGFIAEHNNNLNQLIRAQELEIDLLKRKMSNVKDMLKTS